MTTAIYKELTNILVEHDCVDEHWNGGRYEFWYSPISNRPLTVARDMASRKAANKILEDAGIDRRM